MPRESDRLRRESLREKRKSGFNISETRSLFSEEFTSEKDCWILDNLELKRRMENSLDAKLVGGAGSGFIWRTDGVLEDLFITLLFLGRFIIGWKSVRGRVVCERGEGDEGSLSECLEGRRDDQVS